MKIKQLHNLQVLSKKAITEYQNAQGNNKIYYAGVLDSLNYQIKWILKSW